MFASVLPRLRAAASAAQLLPRAGATAWRAPPLSTSMRRLVSVWQARKAVFDTAMPDVPNHRFKSLQYLKRKGLMGPKARRRRVHQYTLPPAHSRAASQWESYLPEQSPLAKHPIVRKALNEERLRKLEIVKKSGRAPPKKGSSKRTARRK